MCTHPNVIREIMTPPDGLPIESGGTIGETVQTLLDPMWNAENLYLVGIVHRAGGLGGRRMHVFNTAVGDISPATGIGETLREESQAGRAVYDLSGRKVADAITSHDSLPKGLYIVNGKKFVVK